MKDLSTFFIPAIFLRFNLKVFLLCFLIYPFNTYALTVIELNKDGQEIVKDIPKKFLKRRTKKVMKLFSHSLKQSTGLKIKPSKKWQLDSVEIAPSIHASVGIGRFGIGGIAGFKMLWERREK